jgi:hypothetical protein
LKSPKVPPSDASSFIPLKRRFVGKPLALNRDSPNGLYLCSLFSTIPPLAFVAKDAEPRLVLSAAKDGHCANTHVLNEVKDQRRANPHRDSLATKACPERSEG